MDTKCNNQVLIGKPVVRHYVIMMRTQIILKFQNFMLALTNMASK